MSTASRDRRPTSVGRDGVTVYEDARQGRVVKREVDVRLPRSAHITNARTGEALGDKERLRTRLTAGEALVLSLGSSGTPLRLEGPGDKTERERSSVARPLPFRFRFSAGLEKKGPGGCHSSGPR